MKFVLLLKGNYGDGRGKIAIVEQINYLKATQIRGVSVLFCQWKVFLNTVTLLLFYLKCSFPLGS